MFTNLQKMSRWTSINCKAISISIFSWSLLQFVLTADNSVFGILSVFKFMAIWKGDSHTSIGTDGIVRVMDPKI